MFCSSSPSIWYATWPCLKKNVWPPGYPQCPKVPPLGHDPGDRIKIPSDMFCIFHFPLVSCVRCGTWLYRFLIFAPLLTLYISFVRTHTKFGIKIFEIDMVRNLMIFDLWPHPKVTSLTLGWKFYLRSVLLVIPVDLIYRMTIFEKNVLLGTLSAPKSHPWGKTQGTEWKSRLICFVSFICENTHKVWF